MRVVIEKSLRQLTLWDGEQALLRTRVALGRNPVGGKQREGDLRTPEGLYQICLAKEQGKYGKSLGLNYPNAEDAHRGFQSGQIDQTTLQAVVDAVAAGRRPPWGTPLGGEVYLHAGDVQADWTAGCIALAQEDMDVLFACRNQIEDVEIRP
ncbi:MAG: L,D-transpeptidase family protein [Candidatus Limiplasma sp.]|nr:L,D-transpeptidase family protein [Candidatus Limiplasma sp.]